MSDLASVPQWLPQTWDSSDAVHGHLVEASRALKEPGRFEEALQHFRAAYEKHLQDLTRPHLSFSCLFPLFSSLRLSDAPEHGTRGQIACCEDHISDAFTCCRALLESLASSFTDPPSDSPPEGCSRQRFVHELGAQAGVYLDMVRLGHAHRRKKTKVLSVAPSTPELSQAPDTPASSQGCATPYVAGREDYRKLVHAGFMGAGRFLRSLQVAMDELHDEALRAAADMKQGKPPENMPIGISQDGLLDSQLLQTFGEFFDAQLLPLYVRDMPMDWFGETLLHYCGIPVDEEDEIKARQILGIPPRVRGNKPKQLGKQISDASTTPATPSSGSELSLKQILQASTQERKLRDQMSNSVVEKRRLGLSAHPDLRIPRDVATPATARRDAPFATPDRKKRRLDRHGAMTGGPTPRVSRALLMSPEVLEDCSDAPSSPVRWQASEQPSTALSMEQELTACWSVMDTPKQK